MLKDTNVSLFKRKRARSNEPSRNFSHGFDLDMNLGVKLINSSLRSLSPYFHSYPCYVKQRWRGRAILEVFCRDFDSHDEVYFKKAIESGLITVNGDKVTCEYALRDGDYIVHLLHRHEPAVSGDPIEILSPSLSTKKHPSFFAVLKPGGIPVHPCGPHQFLSLLALLARDSHNIRNLHPVHRLDRLTSGIVLMATGKDAASKMSAQFRGENGGVRKRYVAIVDGEFPLAPGASDGKMIGSIFDTSFGSNGATEFKRACKTSDTTDVSEKALTTDTSDQALNESRNEGTSKSLKFPVLTSMELIPLDPPTCEWIHAFKPHEIIAYADEGASVDKKRDSMIDAAAITTEDVTVEKGKIVTNSTKKLIESSHLPEMRERHFQEARVNTSSSGSQPPLPLSSDADTLSQLPDISWVKRTVDGPAYLRVAVAIRTTDQKNALQNIVSSSTSSLLSSSAAAVQTQNCDAAASNTGYKGDPFSSVGIDKESVTLFRRIACVKERDDSNVGKETLSLIEVIPISGRTHQIRLHAAWLGFPIKEDVVYNRRAYNKLLIHDSTSSDSSHISKTSTDTSIPMHAHLSIEEEAAINLCVYCTKGASAEFTAVQRKPDGICLHSCEYEGGNNDDESWHVKAPLPPWVEDVLKYC